MKIQDLALFVLVTEHMSFTEAANVLDLPQSNVSRKIKQMEDKLQVRLFERNSNGINLTEQGELFYTHSKQLVDEFSFLTERLVDYKNEPEGTLTVCMAPFMAELLSKEFFDSFMRAFPKINLVYHALNPEHLEHGLNADLMLYIYPPKNQNLIARRIATFSRRFYASPEYLVKHGTPTHPSELNHHRCLSFDSKVSPVNEWFYHEEQMLKPVSVTGPFTSDSINLTLDMAAQGHGICWVPQFIANKKVREGKLVCLFDGKFGFEQPLYAIFHPRKYMPKKLYVFLEMITQYMERNCNVFNESQ